MVPEPGCAPRRQDPGVGQGPPRHGPHRDARGQAARLADHDGAVARVRQVPGRDQARHSGRAAQPSLNLNVTDTATIIARVRAAATGSKVYEVDFREQREKKRAVLAAASVAIPERLRFVACDFNAADFESSLVSGLVAEGFSVSGLTLFLWEGVITYLTANEIDRTLSWMATVRAPRSRVVFNYTINHLAGNVPEAMRAR